MKIKRTAEELFDAAGTNSRLERYWDSFRLVYLRRRVGRYSDEARQAPGRRGVAIFRPAQLDRIGQGAGDALTKRIVLIDAHPDPDERRFCHALAKAYCAGAESGGHSVRRVTLAQLKISFLHKREEWEESDPNESIQHCQQAIAWSEHIVIIYPLWLGSLPALLQAFLEQTFRPGFAIAKGKRTLWPGLLKGKSARIVVTMGMPSLFYRLYFGAHSLKTLKRNILGFAGISPIRETLIGSVESGGAVRHKKIIDQMTALGLRGA